MTAIPLPDSMPAVEISRPGPPDVLIPVARRVPQPAPGEVLIRVAAAGVNRPDCLQRQGGYPPPPGASDLPGLEVAGTVVAAGAGAGIDVGTRVCALLAGGGYAGFVAVPAVQCLNVPRALTLIEAAALPETYFTVWTNLFERAALKAGETVLIHGGASGIGSTAILLARAFGARVFATVGSDEKRAFAERLGAERAVNHRTEKFVEVVKAAAGEVDVILDIVGAPYLADNLRLLREDGRLAVVAMLGGAKAEVNLGPLLFKRLTITGSTLRSRSPAEKGRIGQALKRHVWPLLEERIAVPPIQTVLPLAQAAEAHRLLEANAAMGKVVLRVTDEA